jgi:hypothetical protein
MTRDPYLAYLEGCVNSSEWLDATLIYSWRCSGGAPPELRFRALPEIAALARASLASLVDYPHPNRIIAEQVKRSAEMLLHYVEIGGGEFPVLDFSGHMRKSTA